MKTPIVLEPDLVNTIAHIGMQRKPNEACGVITPTPHKGRRVFEVPNRSSLPRDSFEMSSEDIVLELRHWMANNQAYARWDQLVMWHTHPGGNIGPSQTDVENRIEHCGNLVVALLDCGPHATWF